MLPPPPLPPLVGFFLLGARTERTKKPLRQQLLNKTANTMPDLARSTSEMLEEMKKIVQQPEGNTSCAKHRQNVASAITTLIKEQITDAPFRQLYIADAGGKKARAAAARSSS